MKPKALLYIALPNLTFLPKRIKFLFGKSINDPIENYFSQLKANTSAIVDIHWREYTGDELKELLQRMGFRIEQHYYFHNAQTRNRNFFRKNILKLLYRNFPALLPAQVALQ